jgi:DNA-binding IclR family transcriptional regulator
LSLGHAYKTSSNELKIAEPLMRQASEKHKLNVGLAVADRLDMVYLESVRYNKNVALRAVAAGQRVPIERTSLGLAWIARLDSHSQENILNDLRKQKRRSVGTAFIFKQFKYYFASSKRSRFITLFHAATNV